MSDLTWLVQRVSGGRPAQPGKAEAKPGQTTEPARTTYVATRRKAKPNTPKP